MPDVAADPLGREACGFRLIIMSLTERDKGIAETDDVDRSIVLQECVPDEREEVESPRRGQPANS